MTSYMIKDQVRMLGIFLKGFGVLSVFIFGIGAGTVSAASIVGAMSVTGAYSANSGLDTATVISLDTADVSGTGDFNSLLNTPATVINSIDIGSFSPISLLTVNGWQLDLDSLTIVQQTPSILRMSGTGVLSGNGADPTPADWNLSANAIGSTYSMVVQAVPVPAAVWLFGSGLLGLVGIARRKKAA